MNRNIDNLKVLALIPARGGSKSIPRKNLQILAGTPLISWTIDVAKRSKEINRILLTTDDEEIASVGSTNGAEVPFLRPKTISGDLSLDYEYHLHALNYLKEHDNYIPDLIVNLRPTCPGRDPLIIDEAINYFLSQTNIDSLRSVQVASQSPFKMWSINKEGILKNICSINGIPEPYNQPRQLLPKIYWQDGYVDITTPKVIYEKKSTTGEIICPFLIKEVAVDIDYPEDLKEAEAHISNKDSPESSTHKEKNYFRHPS